MLTAIANSIIDTRITGRDIDLNIIRMIIKTREELKCNNQNFESATEGLIDYYVYQIKANQSKLDYLIKLAKKKGVILSRDKEVKIRMILQKKLVG